MTRFHSLSNISRRLASLTAVLSTCHAEPGIGTDCLHLPAREEREQRRADIEHLAGSLVNKVNECVAAIDEGAGLSQMLLKLSLSDTLHATSLQYACTV